LNGISCPVALDRRARRNSVMLARMEFDLPGAFERTVGRGMLEVSRSRRTRPGREHIQAGDVMVAIV
jgi:hypothetical protein